GRTVRTLSGDGRTALTGISVISGLVAILATAWLGVELDRRRGRGRIAGLIAALWLMTLPVFWLSSEMALSDVPGVALILLAAVALWKGQRDARWLVVGAALGGLCLGLRPQNGLPLILFAV